MRYATTDHLRVDETMEAFFQAVSGMPVKASANMAEVADPTVGRWRKKEVDPSVRPFLLMVRRLPLHLKRTILGPVLDDLGALDNAMRLSAMASSLKEMAEHVDEISRANRAGRGGLRDVLGFGRAAGAGVDAEPTGLCGDVGGGDGDAGSELDTPLQVTSERLPLSSIARFPTLAAHLERYRAGFGRRDAVDVLAHARGDAEARVGVVLQVHGDVPRHAYKARASRLKHGEVIIGQPVTEGADPGYAALISRTVAEAVESADPVLARLFGSVGRADGSVVETDVVVLRTVDRNNRASAITSHFTPAFA